MAERIVLASVPLVGHTALPVRVEAAACALHYLSNCSAGARHCCGPATLAHVSAALHPMPRQLPSQGQQSFRFVTTCLRLLASIVDKDCVSDEEQLTKLVNIAATWSFFGRAAQSGLASPTPPRDRVPVSGGVPSQLSFGVMGAFAQLSPQKRPPRPTRVPEGPSVVAQRGEDGERPVSDAESGAENSVGWNRQHASAQIRLDTLALLRSIATVHPRALHKHWHLFLADSPFLRSRPTLLSLIVSDPSRAIKMSACATLEAMLGGAQAFLAIAEDRPTKAAFTSLSHKVGGIVTELHLSLAEAIGRSIGAGQSDVLRGELALGRKLASVSPYGRLKRAIAWTLTQALLPLLASPDELLSRAATATALSVIARYKATSSRAAFDWSALRLATNRILESARPAAQADAWRLLASMAGAKTYLDWTGSIEHLSSTFGISAPECQYAQTSFALALAHDSNEGQRQLALPILRQALHSPHAQTIALACSALPLIRGIDQALSAGTLAVPTLLTLLQQSNSAEARSAAIRAIGVVAKESAPSTLPSEQRRRVIEALIHAYSASKAQTCEAPVDGSEALWALANLCDGVTTGLLSHETISALFKIALTTIGADRPTEQLATSSLRIISAVLRCGLDGLRDRRNAFDAGLSSVAQTLAVGLEHKSPKVRWNTCVASATLFQALAKGPGQTDEHTPAANDIRTILVPLLVRSLDRDASLKVRLHAANALQAVETAALPDSVARTSASAAREVTTRLQNGSIEQRDRRHAEALTLQLLSLIDKLAVSPLDSAE